MNEFLDQVFFDNSLRQYLIVGVIVLFVFLAKKYVAHYAASIIYRVLKLRWKTIDKNAFRNLLAKPLGLFLAVIVTVIALNTLTFPAILDFEVYHITFKDILRILGTAAIITSFFLFLIKCMDFIGLMIRDRFRGDEDRAKGQLIFFFKDFIKVILAIVAGLMLLKYCFGYDIKGLVTGLSLVGAAVALALKENLENLIASFIIFFDKPFTTGDVVKVNNITGTVERIGLRSTRIRSEDKTYITVPNKQMSDSILDNLSDRLQRRAALKLELDVHTDTVKIQQLLAGITEILKKPEIQTSSVFMSDISSTAIIVNVDFYTGPIVINQFNVLKQTVYLETLELIEKSGIEIAGKSTEVNISTNGPISPAPSKII